MTFPLVIHPRILSATALRILRQLRSDHRTVALIVMVPILVLTLFYFIYQHQPELPNGRTIFDRIGVVMLAILPFAIMFLITSIAMLRERSSGTLERLMTTPMSTLDLLCGYGIAFSATAAVQASLACLVGFGLLGLTISGSIAMIVAIAVLNAILGVGIGLLASAFARTEFQAVQFMPLVVFPQMILCGLLVPLSAMPTWLEVVSRALPLTYAVEAITEVATNATMTATTWRDLAIVAGFALAALTLGAISMPRKTA